MTHNPAIRHSSESRNPALPGEITRPELSRRCVKTGLFGKERSRRIHDAFDLPQKSDYAPQTKVSEDQAREVVGRAAAFLNDVKEIVEKAWAT